MDFLSFLEYNEKRRKMSRPKYDQAYYAYHDRNDVYDPVLAGSLPAPEEAARDRPASTKGSRRT